VWKSKTESQMVYFRNLPGRFFTRLVIVSAMVFFASVMADAQRGQVDGDRFLETGRAQEILTPGPAQEIKIVSYNIRWRSGKELQQIVEWLKSSEVTAPTIIGLQEVDRAKKRTGDENHAKALAEKLGMHYAWAGPQQSKKEKRKVKEEETGVEILSPYPLEEIRRLVLTSNGPEGRSRVALGATIKIGDTAIRVYSVHGENRLPLWQKLDQWRVVLDDLAKSPKNVPAIVLGDFNSWELPNIEDVREFFTKEGFITPLPDDETTFVRTVLGFNLKLKLDWIWLRGLTPQAYGIDRKLKVSDHFPLWTVVKLPAN